MYGKDANILGNWGQDDRGVADLQTPGVRQRLGQAAPNEVVLVEDPAGSDTYRWLEASGDMVIPILCCPWVYQGCPACLSHVPTEWV